MPLPLLTGVFRVAIERNAGASYHATNVIHVTSQVLTPTQVLAAIDTAMLAGIWALQLNTANSAEVTVTKLDGASPTVGQVFTGAKWTGAIAPGEISPASAPVVTLKTTERGRRHTGRWFYGLVAEEVIGNGAIAAAALGPLQTAWTTFIANCTSAGIPLTVASYGKTSDPPSPTDFPPSSTLVQSATVQQILGTQRRRQSRLRS